MFSTLLEDAQIDVVRALLDGLTSLRAQTGLGPVEERRYQDLCATERSLLSPAPELDLP
ncbi:MAG: hypothetical protein ABSC90_04785 [Acidimicrobiales bacterium]|jgi:hypothetical protein